MNHYSRTDSIRLSLTPCVKPVLFGTTVSKLSGGKRSIEVRAHGLVATLRFVPGAGYVVRSVRDSGSPGARGGLRTYKDLSDAVYEFPAFGDETSVREALYGMRLTDSTAFI